MTLCKLWEDLVLLSFLQYESPPDAQIAKIAEDFSLPLLQNSRWGIAS